MTGWLVAVSVAVLVTRALMTLLLQGFVGNQLLEDVFAAICLSLLFLFVLAINFRTTVVCNNLFDNKLSKLALACWPRMLALRSLLLLQGLVCIVLLTINC